MRIGIAGTQTTELVAKSIKEILSDAGFESFYFSIYLFQSVSKLLKLVWY